MALAEVTGQLKCKIVGGQKEPLCLTKPVGLLSFYNYQQFSMRSPSVSKQGFQKQSLFRWG